MLSSTRRPRWLSALVAALFASAAILTACGDDDDGGNDGTATEAEHAEATPFGYDGEDGPNQWASLDPAYAECGSGREQSPIDLSGGTTAELPEIEFSPYQSSEIELENTGHSIQANYEPGSSEITLDGVSSELGQFHYHGTSEHRLDGKTLPLEFHFVYMDADGNPTVIGVFAAPGRPNPAYDGLIGELAEVPAEGDHVSAPGIDPASLMPPDPGSTPRWTYEGSLTTPPCTEGVSWQVLKQPVELSREQIERLSGDHVGNNRPVQPLNGRELRQSAGGA